MAPRPDQAAPRPLLPAEEAGPPAHRSLDPHPDPAPFPSEPEFATKGELARHIVLRSLASPLPIAWVAADAAHGQESRFRRLLEQSGFVYVRAVPKSRCTVGCPRVDGLFAQAPAEAWERISCGDGAKGPRAYHWAAVRLPAVAEFDYQGEDPHPMRWALARRSIRKPDEITYYLAYALWRPPFRSWFESPRRAGRSKSASRPRRTSAAWTSTKSVATWAGYRHITLAMLAHAFLAATAHQVREKGAVPVGQEGQSISQWRRFGDSWQLVVPDRRIFLAAEDDSTALSWSNWRRRRQAVARRCHYLRRCRTIEGRLPKVTPDHSATHYTPAVRRNPQVRQRNPAGVLGRASPGRSTDRPTRRRLTGP